MECWSMRGHEPQPPAGDMKDPADELGAVMLQVAVIRFSPRNLKSSVISHDASLSL